MKEDNQKSDVNKSDVSQTSVPDRFQINRWLMQSQDFQFKRHYSRLMEGICPKCGQFSCIVNMENPDRIRCSRLNQCGWSAPISAYFTQISKEA